jgi:hypothetical protein
VDGYCNGVDGIPIPYFHVPTGIMTSPIGFPVITVWDADTTAIKKGAKALSAPAGFVSTDNCVICPGRMRVIL